jgi:para-aminobenzoate synthetase component 1
VPPFVQELIPTPAVGETLSRFIDWENLVLFDSARRDRHGLYSFLTANPQAHFVIATAEYGADPFAEVRPALARQPFDRIDSLPPFQGGAAGLLAYELGACWERLPSLPRSDRFPAAVFGIYDWTISWDHQQNRAWLIVQSSKRSAELTRQIQAQLTQPLPTPSERLPPPDVSSAESTLRSNFSKGAYLAAVERVIEYIRAGDIFQANLSQQLTAPAPESPLSIYLRLREVNSAPFAGYLAHGDWAVLSSSPERFLEARGAQVYTRPIKGTRQRPTDPLLDLMQQDELRESGKDQAENVMIVDLLRNDLSRVCQPGTIRVSELCTLETYASVSHLVSEVTGTLRQGSDFWDLLRVSFPGGSITGAPKIRAMEIIAELERVPRQAYCGSLFYCSPDGVADSNLLIRTITWQNGQLTFPVGGGVVVDSQPEAEYAETWHKARGMLQAVGLSELELPERT